MQSGNKKIRILLVDDHAVVRAGYQMLLNQSDKMEIIAEASSGEQASKLFTDLNPDVVVMDLSLPGIGGWRPSNASSVKTPMRRYWCSACMKIPFSLTRPCAPAPGDI